MGDGRYYTIDQFMVVSCLTVFLICTSVSAVMCWYQGIREKGRFVFFAHLFLGLAGAMRIAEAVLVSPDLAGIAKSWELACIILFLGAISGLIRSEAPGAHLIHGVLSVLSLFFLVAAGSHPWWMVQDYTFAHFRFGAGYLWTAGIWLGFCLPLIFVSKQRLPAAAFFILPLGGHWAAALVSDSWGNLALLAGYPVWLASIHMVSRDSKAYRIGGQVFADINNLINDAVLVCDPSNNIIFRNRHAREADFLVQDAASVTKKNPGSVFSKTMAPCRKYEFNTFASKDRDRYMDCRTKDIRQGKRLVGRALVISDITELISMLDLQAEQKASLESVNQKLHQYSNIVFDLEKEKEVSSLLSGITHTQEQFLESFGNRINALARISSTSRFDARIQTLIEDAKTNLADIRQTVARYRRYYGTGN